MPSATAVALAALWLATSVPGLIPYQRADVTHPLWVAAEEAVAEDGTLRLDLFSQSARVSLRGVLAANTDGECNRYLGEPISLNQVSDRTLDDLVASASIIVSGTVSDARQGFLAGVPGTLVAIHDTTRLKAVKSVSAGDVLYVFFPTARIETKQGPVCGEPPARATAVPESGDRLIAFLIGGPVDQRAEILSVDVTRHLLVQPRNAETFNQAFLAAQLPAEARQFDVAVERIRNHAAIRSVPKSRLP